MKSIGTFMGKEITEMTRDELLEFAKFAVDRIQNLERQLEPFEDVLLEKEVLELLRGTK